MTCSPLYSDEVGWLVVCGVAAHAPSSEDFSRVACTCIMHIPLHKWAACCITSVSIRWRRRAALTMPGLGRLFTVPYGGRTLDCFKIGDVQEE